MFCSRAMDYKEHWKAISNFSHDEMNFLKFMCFNTGEWKGYVHLKRNSYGTHKT